MSRCWNGGVFNKAPLLQLLSGHPNWDSDALALVYTVQTVREPESSQVWRNVNRILELGAELGLSQEDQRSLDFALSTLVTDMSQYIQSDAIVATLQEVCDVPCKVGQRTSRVQNRVCRKYGIDKHALYNARFAELADSVNPLYLTRTAVLSLHPCDYLEMSNTDNSWSSCHNLRNGGYRAGTLSYLTDTCSMIFYTMDPEKVELRFRAPKITREVFCYENGILLQSRLYPNTDDKKTMATYRALIQQSIAECLGEPNLWTTKSSGEAVEQYVKTCEAALHYPDYIYPEYGASVSTLQSKPPEDDSCITVGSLAMCLYCGLPLRGEEDVLCYECDGAATCCSCGARIPPGDALYVGGEVYCDSCVTCCDICSEYTLEDMTWVLVENDVYDYVCSDCCEKYTSTCEVCGKVCVTRLITRVEDRDLCPMCAAAASASA